MQKKSKKSVAYRPPVFTNMKMKNNNNINIYFQQSGVWGGENVNACKQNTVITCWVSRPEFKKLKDSREIKKIKKLS